MTEEPDFERAWLKKLSACIDEIAGEKVQKEVMERCEGLSSQSDRHEVIAWSKGAMERLDSLVGAVKRKKIMTGCACHYLKSNLQGLREEYEAT